MGDQPLTIRPEDIIKRPPVLPGAAAPLTEKKGGFLNQIVDGLKQAKELKKSLEDMGINVDSFLGLPGKQAAAAPVKELPPGSGERAPIRTPPPPPPVSPLDQIKGLVVVLQLRYGDCTVCELIDHLREDYGQKKLSEFTKAKK